MDSFVRFCYPWLLSGTIAIKPVVTLGSANKGPHHVNDNAIRLLQVKDFLIPPVSITIQLLDGTQLFGDLLISPHPVVAPWSSCTLRDPTWTDAIPCNLIELDPFRLQSGHKA